MRAPLKDRFRPAEAYRTETVMVSREDLESFFIRMDVEYEEVDKGMWLVRGRNSPPILTHWKQK